MMNVRILDFSRQAPGRTTSDAPTSRRIRAITFMASAELRALTFDQRCDGALLLRLNVRGDAGRKFVQRAQSGRRRLLIRYCNAPNPNVASCPGLCRHEHLPG